MGVATFEGVVENGQIRLAGDVHLPERAKVYVLVPDAEVPPVARLVTPHLRHPEQAADLRMQVVEEPRDAGV